MGSFCRSDMIPFSVLIKKIFFFALFVMLNVLNEALNSGRLSPFEFALIDEWHRDVKSGRSDPAGYGILIPPTAESLPRFNVLRHEVYLRPIEVRNRLVEVQSKTGMDFYLPGKPWVNGKIKIGD